MMIDPDRFQPAVPALPMSNRVPPIKVSVTQHYGTANLPPTLTFFINMTWLRDSFGVGEGTCAAFAYDNAKRPQVGMLTFGQDGTPLTPGGAHQWKANFYGWPGLDPFQFRKRSSCPIIETDDRRVCFHMPPNRMVYNPNTGTWDVPE